MRLPISPPGPKRARLVRIKATCVRREKNRYNPKQSRLDWHKTTLDSSFNLRFIQLNEPPPRPDHQNEEADSGISPIACFMSDFFWAFKKTNKYFWPVLKRSWVWLLGVTICSEAMYQYFTYIAQNYRPPSGVNVPATLGDLVASLLEFIVLTMLIPQRVMELDRNDPPQSFIGFAKKYIKPLTAESLRALAMTILWTLVFIVPGIFKYVRYFLVGYVVVADPEYEAGNVDALKESNRLVKGITIELFIFVVILIFLDSWQSTLREHDPFTTAPVVAALATVVFFFLNYYANVFLFMLYQSRKLRLGHSVTAES